MSQKEISTTTLRVLVTGANSGIGFAACRRLIDEFLQTRPQNESLDLVITTRDAHKGRQTAHILQDHVSKATKNYKSNVPEAASRLSTRISIKQELLDLTSLTSVQALGKRLNREYDHIDVLICNAGIGAWAGLNWARAVWKVLTDWVNATTWPDYQYSAIGLTAKPQTQEAKTEPVLGEVFCANVFGHYMLAHYAIPLLSKSPNGRVVWVSTVEAKENAFSIADMQAIKAPLPYRSSKRLTDLLVINSSLPSTAPIVEPYFKLSTRSNRPRMYLCHPGVCATTIVPLPYILWLAYFGALYVSRWLGSIWHCITPYQGATSLVWLALADKGMLDVLEENQGVGKWGSATDRGGNERVERTEVEGWGYGGIAGDASFAKGRRKGRAPEAKDLTDEDRTEFEQLGRDCWSQMEQLRIEWEARLDATD